MAIYEIPASVKELFDYGETMGYRIIDYTKPEMDNIQSMAFFLELIGVKDENIFQDDGTQVILMHPDYEYKLVIDSGGLGDFYAHGFTISLFKE